MKIIVLILAVFNFLSYFWSVIGVFSKQRERHTAEYRILQLSSLATWIYNTYLIAVSDIQDQAAFILIFVQIFCAVAFWMHTQLVKKNSFSIAFSKDKPKRLVRNLFYSRVRHPFYMIYLLTYLSIAVAYENVISGALFFLMLLVYYRAASVEEKKFLDSDLSQDYLDYRKKAGMFFPKFW